MPSIRRHKKECARGKKDPERSQYSVSVVLYKLVSRSWEALGGGAWAEMHLFFRPQGDSRAFRLVAWIPESQDVILNLKLSPSTRLEVEASGFGELEGFGMYFSSREEAGATADAIAAAADELNTKQKRRSLAEIQEVQSVSHDTHVVFNAEESRFEGLPEGWQTANKQFAVPVGALPRVDVEGYDDKIPSVVVMLARKLDELNGHGTLGIFRVAPDQEDCREAREAIDRGGLWDTQDPHVVATLIKVFFRELPIGLLNWLGDASLAKLARHEPCADVVSDLADPHRSLLLWLLDLMATIVTNEHTNKMSAKNMAIVMSPNLYSTHAENPMAALTMAQTVADATKNLLAWRLADHHNYADDDDDDEEHHR
ncbi:hypothetical protein CTAYLR_007194 [Chrysophaeum taylorii]|uniref:Rho-GAP domain-containing protein n=1 Tax=Chrysophaeum taylorii TaxID=2483200 RepID=A0AAD7UNY1_9STRA|nr:hypothetical protein CTAYLR_007194 [Chrysophaeum taylorii]